MNVQTRKELDLKPVSTLEELLSQRPAEERAQEVALLKHLFEYDPRLRPHAIEVCRVPVSIYLSMCFVLCP